MRFDDAVEVDKEGGNDEDCAEEDADEGEAFFAEVEFVDSFEDEREGLEPDVEETVDESDVEVEEEDDGFAEVERDGADECDEHDVFACHFLGDEFGLAGQGLDSGEFAEATGASVENVGGAGFGEEEDEEDEGEAR